MIQVDGLEVAAGSFRLVDISFHVAKGEHVALMGRTGRGKTTLLEAVCGLRSITRGSITVAGRDVTRLPAAQRHLGYVPQDLALFPNLTVRDHLEFALRLRRMPRASMAVRSAELAHWLGLSHLMQRNVTTLSGGEAQRTALGRALSFAPEVLLLDEPLSALDEATREDLHEVLRNLRAKAPVTLLHVTHNPNEAAALADRIIRLEDGRILP